MATSYRILVVDDEPGSTEEFFKRLFLNDKRFIYTQARKPGDFKDADISGYDAVLLDINLNEWGITLSDALSIVGSRSPVVLSSRYWDKEETHRKISEVLAGVSNVKFIATLVLNNLGEIGWESHAESMRGQLCLAIEKERRRALLDLDDNAPVRILHLSDPQYNDPHTDNWSEYVEDEIGQFILRDLDLEIHFIAITGDISYSGEVHQFKEAEQKLSKLIRRFFPMSSDWRERVLLVPGNHDVNLKLAVADRVQVKIKVDKDEGKDTASLSIELDKVPLNGLPHRKFALAPFRDFAYRLTGDPHWQDADELNWINDSFRHIGLRFFLLNSVSTIDCEYPKKAGFQRDALNSLGSADVTQEQPFGIAFSHHGPPEKEVVNVDTLTDWPQTSQFLKTRGVKLFVHGHGHERKVDLFNRTKQTTASANKKITRAEILRVMAPTSHLDKKMRPESESRGFNLITLHRTHGKVSSIEVASYELSESNEPTQAENSPWTCYL